VPRRTYVCYLLVWLACFGIALSVANAQTVDDTTALPTDGRPIARIKTSIICCPREQVVLDGWASIDVGGEVVEWLWDYTEDGRPDTSANTGEMILTAPRTARTYFVALTVRDNEGNLSEPDTVTVHIMDPPPSVGIRADTTVKVGTRVKFSPTVQWVCAEPVRYEWDFDNDGKPEYHSSRNGNTSRVYDTPGIYRARFRVVDKFGKEAGALTEVTVVARHAQAHDDGGTEDDSRNTDTE
jgi:PKD repeat protein